MTQTEQQSREYFDAYTSWREATEAYDAAIQQVISGTPVPDAEMTRLIETMKVRHTEWMEKSKPFTYPRG
jgi:hypothetical protein